MFLHQSLWAYRQQQQIVQEQMQDDDSEEAQVFRLGIPSYSF